MTRNILFGILAPRLPFICCWAKKTITIIIIQAATGYFQRFGLNEVVSLRKGKAM